MATIPLSEITTGYVDGNGIFDILMGAVNSHLEKEYNDGRIKGSDYATVYLGSIQAVLQQAMQFSLGRQQADKQADLTDKNIEKTQAEIDLLIAKKFSEQANILDTVDGNTVEGVVGKQKQLYTKQADGFDRDAERSVLKLLVDLYSVAKSSDPTTITNFRWFAATSQYTDELEAAINDAVVNAGLSQILNNT